ncbi:type II toxin-antitoxin system RelE/ParE family toxin [Massilibacteroides sp.]|uniref:type II toxin-antitoxin system RelE/ParE family toxin n=1 Tax=Massilibacteroides sp. TaxID=2034766 RepID=UPI002607A999|nr:type II toxin-antitoxin system RelE/ParE family toxin [Massilibacteroides sp.]MDD4515870.1 type II toxin-antitoxin system RelE/ParE family toxin [Massilibacteroides sp.]
MENDQNQGLIREVFYTEEFFIFYKELNVKVQTKIDYVITLIKDIQLIHTGFVKKLVDTELYEMRVSISSNEYRTILFAVDHKNIIEATKVVILNGFLKKSTKDYLEQINKAKKILNELE